jgi:DNA-binding NarL/FixJ family response regulator
MNGLEEARARMKLMTTVPVIVFTTFVSSALEKDAAASGVSAIVSKSERPTVLIETARTLLGKMAA